MTPSIFGQAPKLLSDSSRAQKRFDFWLVLAASLLLIAGLLCLYSEGTKGHDGGLLFKKQVLFWALGLIPFAIFAFSNLKFWMRAWPLLYIINLAGLATVLVHGSVKNGSARWIQLGPMEFQPSEMAKLFTVITLASFYIIRKDELNKLSTFLLGLLHVMLPMLLIALQPHYGAAMVIGVIWISISTVARVPMKYLGPTLAVVLVLMVAIKVSPKSVPFLHSYQISRMKEGMQVHRSQVAFGVGGLMGAGFGKGEVTQNFPEIEDDFIFTLAGEELGLVGCTLILAGFGFLFYRLWLVMLNATDPFHRMLVTGIIGIFASHTFVNLLMVTGVLPVIGLWLPFMSYGGTALWLCMSCIGLAINVRRAERPILF